MASPSVATRTAAIDLVEHVADGKGGRLSSGIEAQVGLAIGQLNKEDFQTIEIRVDAIRPIRRIAGPDALDYLKSLKPGWPEPGQHSQALTGG